MGAAAAAAVVAAAKELLALRTLLAAGLRRQRQGTLFTGETRPARLGGSCRQLVRDMVGEGEGAPLLPMLVTALESRPSREHGMRVPCGQSEKRREQQVELYSRVGNRVLGLGSLGPCVKCGRRDKAGCRSRVVA